MNNKLIILLVFLCDIACAMDRQLQPFNAQQSEQKEKQDREDPQRDSLVVLILAHDFQTQDSVFSSGVTPAEVKKIIGQNYVQTVIFPEWVKHSKPQYFFMPVDQRTVVSCLEQIMVKRKKDGARECISHQNHQVLKTRVSTLPLAVKQDLVSTFFSYHDQSYNGLMIDYAYKYDKSIWRFPKKQYKKMALFNLGASVCAGICGCVAYVIGYIDGGGTIMSVSIIPLVTSGLFAAFPFYLGCAIFSYFKKVDERKRKLGRCFSAYLRLLPAPDYIKE